MNENYQIITFYEFKVLKNVCEIRQILKRLMQENTIFGTIILADEGFNATICGFPAEIEKFVAAFESLLNTKLDCKTSFHQARPFQRTKVRIKREIVTLKQKVNIEKGNGTHTRANEWNKIINDSETVVLDTRNKYECSMGSFRGAVNPKIDSFSQLPAFVEKNLNPDNHKKVAIFCTGGVRCEKFAPFLKDLGFAEIFQLEGGILRYLEEIPASESLWEGECFVFDERISV
ncbi:MAG: rhodanese-like domain-containing protein [Acidobacteriota bacterium]|nr:rhodanese-like domain-containing protein [Acidobacteriota bacterium]